MTEKTIKHEVKLQKSVIAILAVLAFGVCANAFGPAFSIKDALAQVPSFITIQHMGSIGR